MGLVARRNSLPGDPSFNYIWRSRAESTTSCVVCSLDCVSRCATLHSSVLLARLCAGRHGRRDAAPRALTRPALSLTALAVSITCHLRSRPSSVQVEQASCDSKRFFRRRAISWGERGRWEFGSVRVFWPWNEAALAAPCGTGRPGVGPREKVFVCACRSVAATV